MLVKRSDSARSKPSGNSTGMERCITAGSIRLSPGS
jgi:hypothetical protein